MKSFWIIFENFWKFFWKFNEIFFLFFFYFLKNQWKVFVALGWIGQCSRPHLVPTNKRKCANRRIWQPTLPPRSADDDRPAGHFSSKAQDSSSLLSFSDNFANLTTAWQFHRLIQLSRKQWRGFLFISLGQHVGWTREWAIRIITGSRLPVKGDERAVVKRRRLLTCMNNELICMCIRWTAEFDLPNFSKLSSVSLFLFYGCN